MKALIWARETRSDHAGRELHPAARHLLLLLASYDVNGGRAWPSLDELAERMGYRVRHVQRLMRDLENRGLLEVTRAHRRPNRYRLLCGVEDVVDLVAPVAAPQCVADADEEYTPKAIARALVNSGGLLEAYMEDLADDPTQAYLATLAGAEELARDHADLSPNLSAYLRNAVLTKCAQESHELDSKQLGRLFREAKGLGAQGPEALIVAMWRTASADVKGDRVSYIAATARRILEESRAVAS